MRWSTFETPEGQKISIDMDEIVTVINYPGDKADLCMKNGTLHTVIFMGQWKPEVYHLPEVHPLPDWDPEILRSEIQDLKLENDRLKQRDAIMLNFIKSIDCTDRTCIRCALSGANGACKWTLFPNRVEMVNDVLKKLEDL